MPANRLAAAAEGSCSPSGVAVRFDPTKWLVPGAKVEIELDPRGPVAAEVATS